jgi:hypothetical protein
MIRKSLCGKKRARRDDQDGQGTSRKNYFVYSRDIRYTRTKDTLPHRRSNNTADTNY